MRDPLPNPGWKPLLLSTHQVSSYKGLVQVLDYIASVANHTQPIVPILVDENIHKICLKLLYSDRTQRWNWHEKLKRTPVLYGYWHPYKYLVTNASRRFHSLFVYFRFGRLGVKKQWGPTRSSESRRELLPASSSVRRISCGSCAGKRTGYRLLPITGERRSID